MTLHGYSARKAAQVAAFFAIKEGGAINVLKLAKLLYLSDREHLSQYDFPIERTRFRRRKRRVSEEGGGIGVLALFSEAKNVVFGLGT